MLRLAPVGADASDPDASRELPLPTDLPPTGALTVTIPADRLPPAWAGRPLEVEPAFRLIGHVAAAPAVADLRISAGGPVPGIAGSPPAEPPSRR